MSSILRQPRLYPLVSVRWVLAWVLVCGWLGGAARSLSAEEAAEPAWTQEQIAFFQEQVRPILQEKCWKCHGVDKQRGSLRLDSRQGVLTGGDLGPAVQLDDPSSSQLLTAIRYEELEMPPDGRLPAEQVAILEKWVSQGMPWTPGEVAAEAKHHAKVPLPEDPHWAYLPRKTQAAPAVSDAEWTRNPIDRWVKAGLERESLDPNPPASRRTMIRRLYYDLIGLPPSLVDVERFERDESPQAYEQMVDRLLSSPQYGEKWGRHWLDLVRYAETNGYERDGIKANAWRYRDYVIRAFNQDKPYDRFVMEQLAGDELPDRDHDSITATAFYRLGIWDDEPADPDQAYYDSLDDVISTTGLVFLGTTVGCARCHDHKIDPIPQRDYYRMMAFFHNILQDSVQLEFKKTAFSLNTQTVIASQEERDVYERQRREHEEQLKALKDRLDSFEQRVYATLSNPEKEDARDEAVREQLIEKRAPRVLDETEFAEYAKVRRDFRRLRREEIAPLPETLSVRENGRTPRETFVLVRGSAAAPGDRVEPGVPAIFSQIQPQPAAVPDGVESSGYRTAFASWLVDPHHPLTARVIANRIWQHHFGRGLVATSSDYGRQGDPPTHPELLDYLAQSLIDHQWQIKWLHRQIVTSQTYRMSSADRADALQRDPENKWLWRYNMRRLGAEELRDTVLTISGQLNPQMGGPSVYSVIPDAVLQTASRPDAAWGHSSPADQVRRSVYVHVKRSVADPVLRGFDAADTDGSCPIRFATTVPTQALTTLNGQFFQDQARVMAARLKREEGDDAAKLVRRALELSLSRPITDDEVQSGVELLDEWQKEDRVSQDDALRFFCLMVLNLNETVFVD